jgi:hypothetical protein
VEIEIIGVYVTKGVRLFLFYQFLEVADMSRLCDPDLEHPTGVVTQDQTVKLQVDVDNKWCSGVDI